MSHEQPQREMIAYAGRKYTIEWYYDEAGRSQALEYADELDEGDQKKLAALLMVLGDIGQLRNKEKFRHEGNQIYALKPKPHRFLAFFCEGGKMIITSAFTKKSDKLPPGEKARSIKCKKDYERRVKEKTYYAEES